MLPVAGGVLYIACSTIDQLGDLFIGQLADNFAGSAHDERAGRVGLAFRDQRTGANQAMLTDYSMIQNRRAYTD